MSASRSCGHRQVQGIPDLVSTPWAGFTPSILPQFHHRAVRRRQHRRPVACATRLAAGAGCIARVSDSRSRGVLLTLPPPDDRAPHGRHGRARPTASASFGTSSTERGNSGGIDANVGAKVESADSAALGCGLLDHRFVGFQHWHRRVRAGDGLDAGAERRAGTRMASEPVLTA